MRTSVRMYVGAERLDERERLSPLVGDLDLVPFASQNGTDDQSKVLFVVDDEDTAHGMQTFLHPRRPARNELRVCAVSLGNLALWGDWGRVPG
jgi:hypothetical protein